MDLHTAITLIQSPLARATAPERWADLGAGSGLFTKALARLLPAGSEIYAVDKKPAPAFRVFPETIRLHILQSDFVLNALPFGNLNGILMANSLHFVKDKTVFLEKLKGALKTGGRLIVVEYDTDIPVGAWVPYPLGFLRLRELFLKAGFGNAEKLAEHPSIYGRTIYSATIRI